jgi:uncharacterized membrane protein YedE/YeeE
MASGHGICGMASLKLPSLLAVIIFLSTAIGSAHLLFGQHAASLDQPTLVGAAIFGIGWVLSGPGNVAPDLFGLRLSRQNPCC